MTARTVEAAFDCLVTSVELDKATATEIGVAAAKLEDGDGLRVSLDRSGEQLKISYTKIKKA